MIRLTAILALIFVPSTAIAAGDDMPPLFAFMTVVALLGLPAFAVGVLSSLLLGYRAAMIVGAVLSLVAVVFSGRRVLEGASLEVRVGTPPR